MRHPPARSQVAVKDRPVSRLERLILPLTAWLLLGIAMLMAAPARAEVRTAAPDGFVSVNEAVMPLLPAQVWQAVINWTAWWDPAHSYSGKPGMLRLESRAGGTLSERWPGGSVEHARVVNAMPPALLRLHGGFGPLQALPVDAVLEIAIKADGNGSRLTMSYRVAGSAASKLDTLAAPVDAVMSAGFLRLVNFANTGKP
jgi:hypothetical protein